MSSKKRTSLDAVFGREEATSKLAPSAASTATPPGDQQEKRTGEARRPNVKQHTAYLPLAVHEQLRRLAFEENRKMHDYLVEGLERVFADRGLPTIEDIS